MFEKKYFYLKFGCENQPFIPSLPLKNVSFKSWFFRFIFKKSKIESTSKWQLILAINWCKKVSFWNLFEWLIDSFYRVPKMAEESQDLKIKDTYYQNWLKTAMFLIFHFEACRLLTKVKKELIWLPLSLWGPSCLRVNYQILQWNSIKSKTNTWTLEIITLCFLLSVLFY